MPGGQAGVIASQAAETLESQAEPSLRDYERARIVQAPTEANWSQSQAARTLTISRDNLRHRIKKYKIVKAT